jgi:hypothetical protein
MTAAEADRLKQLLAEVRHRTASYREPSADAVAVAPKGLRGPAWEIELNRVEQAVLDILGDGGPLTIPAVLGRLGWKDRDRLERSVLGLRKRHRWKWAFETPRLPRRHSNAEKGGASEVRAAH